MTENSNRSDWWIYIKNKEGKRLPIVRVLCLQGNGRALCVLGQATRLANQRFISKRIGELTEVMKQHLELDDDRTTWVEYYPQQISPTGSEYLAITRFIRGEDGERKLDKSISVSRERVATMIQEQVRSSKKAKEPVKAKLANTPPLELKATNAQPAAVKTAPKEEITDEELLQGISQVGMDAEEVGTGDSGAPDWWPLQEENRPLDPDEEAILRDRSLLGDPENQTQL